MGSTPDGRPGGDLLHTTPPVPLRRLYRSRCSPTDDVLSTLFAGVIFRRGVTEPQRLTVAAIESAVPCGVARRRPRSMQPNPTTPLSQCKTLRFQAVAQVAEIQTTGRGQVAEFSSGNNHTGRRHRTPWQQPKRKPSGALLPLVGSWFDYRLMIQTKITSPGTKAREQTPKWRNNHQCHCTVPLDVQ